MTLFKIITFLTLSLILSSCSNLFNQSETPLDLPLKDPIVQDTSSSSSLDFESVKKTVFSARCTSCHQQYNTYQGVFRELAAIESAVNTHRMPKSGGPLSELQRSLLLSWIAKGAPEKEGSTGDLNPPFILEANWKSISENIITPKCLVCHNPLGQAKFLDLSTRQKIYDSRNRIFGSGQKLINLESPNQSYLVDILLDEEEPMPPVWSNIPRLSVNEIEIIKQWINLGLP